MSETDSIAEALERIQNQVSWDTPFEAPEFIQPELDIKLDPDHFMRWLIEEGDCDVDESRDYAYNVGSMCEYSCLYAAMMLHEVDMEGELRIMCGDFGFWEHYWLVYILDDKVYFLDLTMQQFVADAPKFAVSEESENSRGYNRKYDDLNIDDGTCIHEYLERKMAFDFYTDPKEIS